MLSKLELPKKKLAIVKKAIKVYNLVPQTDQPENGWSLGEMLMDDRTKAPDIEMVEADNLRLVMTRLNEMDKREATVLRMRFGLNDSPPKTLKEIGESLGLTRERVSQIENEALGKLSATFQADWVGEEAAEAHAFQGISRMQTAEPGERGARLGRLLFGWRMRAERRSKVPQSVSVPVGQAADSDDDEGEHRGLGDRERHGRVVGADVREGLDAREVLGEASPGRCC